MTIKSTINLIYKLIYRKVTQTDTLNYNITLPIPAIPTHKRFNF